MMKTKTKYFKKSLSTAIAVMCAILFSPSLFGQTYQIISWDDYAANKNVPYCPCDSIKCVPPEGETDIIWSPSGVPHTLIGDTLVLENGFNGEVKCFYTGGQKKLYLRPIFPPTSPLFPTDLEICTLSTMLDAGNFSQYGFTSYLWSNGLSSQTITVGPGTYSVTISNACGEVSDEVTISYNNPNAPNLGPDQIFCLGDTTTLDPNVANADVTLWLISSVEIVANTIDISESGIYSVYVLDQDGCEGVDTINVTVNIPIGKEICYVEFDTDSWKNNIVWTANLPENADSVRVYKLDGFSYISIGIVYKDLTNFVDTTSNPQNNSDTYNIAIIDTCGNESVLSSQHKTILLQSIYSELEKKYHFNWSFYEGIVFDRYYLYGITSTNQIAAIGAINSNSNSYTYEPEESDSIYIKYFIGFNAPNCDGAKDGSVTVKSNVLIKDLIGMEVEKIRYIPFSLYPNPVVDQLEISINNSTFEVQILTPLGQVVLTKNNVKTLDVSNLASGLYIISISADGVTTNRMFVKD